MTNCFNCSAELKSDSVNPDTEYQFDNALWVGFFGGYGMFVDDIDVSWGGAPRMLAGAAEEAVICHECAHELCETVPWIKRLLRPQKSHAHTTEYWEANPDHEGWDKDSALERIQKAIQQAKENYSNE